MAKIKITLDKITYGPSTPEVDKLVAFMHADELMREGYRRTSHAYCHVARIDREDWLTVLAKERHLTVADFYYVDGSGIPDHHRDYYVRVHSKDVLTVHPEIVRLIPSY